MRRRMAGDPYFVCVSAKARTPQNSVYAVFHKDFKNLGPHATVGRRFVRCVARAASRRRVIRRRTPRRLTLLRGATGSTGCLRATRCDGTTGDDSTR